MGVHIGATSRIRLNRPYAAAMRPFVKLFWLLVSIANNPAWSYKQQIDAIRFDSELYSFDYTPLAIKRSQLLLS